MEQPIAVHSNLTRRRMRGRVGGAWEASVCFGFRRTVVVFASVVSCEVEHVLESFDGRKYHIEEVYSVVTQPLRTTFHDIHVQCTCCAFAAHMLCMYFAHAMHVRCTCVACAMHVPCTCDACSMHILRMRHACATSVPCACFACAMRVPPCMCHAQAMHLPCTCYEFAHVEVELS